MASLKEMGLSEASLASLVKSQAKKEAKMEREQMKYAKEDLARAVLRLIRLRKKHKDDSDMGHIMP